MDNVVDKVDIDKVLQELFSDEDEDNNDLFGDNYLSDEYRPDSSDSDSAMEDAHQSKRRRIDKTGRTSSNILVQNQTFQIGIPSTSCIGYTITMIC